MSVRKTVAVVAGCALFLGSGLAWSQTLPGEGPRLRENGVTLTQAAIESGAVPLREIRRQGRLVFSTQFNKADGFGDGRIDSADPISPGGRPTLQGNGSFLRVNGLDSQSCLECHSVVSNRTVPASFGAGGAGSSVANVLFQPTLIDVGNADTSFDGRFINPPFLFGSGGVQLLANEMTADLLALATIAFAKPGADVRLRSKGVSFGSIRYAAGEFDTSRVEGVDSDLVVRPFGRKGEFATVRDFARGAFAFHFGMQPVEIVGEDVDADQDDVANEIRVGEVSALEIFGTNLEPPSRDRGDRLARNGGRVFRDVGCGACHRTALVTRSRFLRYRYPEVHDDPDANVYYQVDLSQAPAGFPRRRAGIIVPLYADLKRHDMGPELAESFGTYLDSYFTTARLWGIADSAPYLHDGRATTLAEAILWHGGEAQAARDAYAALQPTRQAQLLAFLRSLRTPRNPAADLDR